jgi:branched-chain amino acid transport system substrate-binding protein
MTMNLKRTFLRALLGAGAGALLACSVQAAEPIRIGVLLSTSGPAASFGIPERDALVLAAEHVNATGGVGGRKLELFQYDDKTNPTEAARGVTQLVANDKVVVIIGPGTGGGALAAGPVAERLQVPLLAPAATIGVTDKANSFFPWIFRVGVDDRKVVHGMLADMAKNGLKRVGIFYQEDAYGKGGADYAKGVARELGLEIVEAVSVPYNAIDVSAQVTRLRNAKPDAMLMQVASAPLATAYVKTAEQLGLKAVTYAGAAMVQKTFVDSVGKAGEGIRVTSIGNLAQDPSPSEAKFAAVVKAAGRTPGGWMELIGSDAIMTVVAAAKKVKGEPAGPAMRDAIESLCNFEQYTRGKTCLNKDYHEVLNESSLVITEIRNGEFRTRK